MMSRTRCSKELPTAGITKLTKHFGKFLSTIEPDAERVSSVAEAHNTLRDHLKQDAELAWPIEDSYLSGSYARDTAIDPVKDVDIILLLKGVEVSASRNEPAPRPILRDIKRVIDDFYDEVDLEQQRRSIRVELPEDSIRMDIVPAVPVVAGDDGIFVPDYEQKCWVKSNPKAHVERKTRLNATNGRFVPLAKMAKWWRDQQIAKSKRPKSFLLECILAEHYVSADSVAETFVATMKAIQAAYRPERTLNLVPRVTDPGISSNNLSESCSWSLESFLAFMDAVDAAVTIAEPALTMERDAAIKQWRKLFKEAFPDTVEESATGKAMAQSSGTMPSAPSQRRALPYTVSVSARLAMSKDGELRENYPSDGRKLAKNIWIRFQVLNTNTPGKYTIRWVVSNHGKESREAGDPGHASNGSHINWEHTKYRGHHFMDCEILKDGVVVARRRHIVNIR